MTKTKAKRKSTRKTATTKSSSKVRKTATQSKTAQSSRSSRTVRGGTKAAAKKPTRATKAKATKPKASKPTATKATKPKKAAAKPTTTRAKAAKPVKKTTRKPATKKPTTRPSTKKATAKSTKAKAATKGRTTKAKPTKKASTAKTARKPAAKKAVTTKAKTSSASRRKVARKRPVGKKTATPAKGKKVTKKATDEARAAAVWDAAPPITENTKVVLTSKAGQQKKPANPDGRLRVPVAGFAVKKRVAKKVAKKAKEEALADVPVADRVEVLKEMKGKAKKAKAKDAKPTAKSAAKKKPRKPRKRRTPAKRKDSDPADMDSNLINSYLKEVSRHNLLTQQEEKDLARAILRDDNSARQRLIQSNLRLVVKMAKKYVKKGVSLLDLIQEGNRGLMMAVEKYDAEKGFRFTTYASWWIKQALIRTIANQSRVIRLPVHMNETIARIKKTARILSLQLGRTPRTSEIAEYIQMPEEKVDYALQANKDTISMDYAKSNNEESGTLNYFLENKNVPRPEDVIKNKLLKEQLEGVLKTLSFKERMVIQYRFGLINGKVKTLEEIGSEFGVTRERIRQIEAKALRQLRHPSRSHKLQDFY